MFPEQTIYISGVRIDEVMIATTDLLLAITCYFAYFKLQSKAGKSVGLFKIYFLLLGIATTWGAFVTHAFFYLFNDTWRTPGWILGMIALTFFVFFSLEQNKDVISNRTKQAASLFILIEVAVMIVLTLTTIHFRWTSIHSAVALVAVATPLNYLNWRKTNNSSSKLILIGVLIFCLSGVIFSLKISPHVWFNHVDLAHVILAAAVYIFYHAARQI